MGYPRRLQTKLPATGSETERCTLEHFVDARNKTADLLRWQNPAWRTLVAK